MNEIIYALAQGEGKVIEKPVIDEHVNLIHFILPQGEGVPIHVSNANLYMVVVRGTLSITLGKDPTQVHEKGQVLNVPYGILMHIRNAHPETLELLVIKTPVPGSALYTKK
jgi:quercetin dioxygenase-like cupin family protein